MLVLFWTVLIHRIRVKYKKLQYDPKRAGPHRRRPLPDDWVFVDPPPGLCKRKRNDDDDGGPGDETPPSGSGGAGQAKRQLETVD